MKTSVFLKELFPKTLNYRLARTGIVRPAMPITLTFSVTAACQSRCRTCGIGDRFLCDTNRSDLDLRLEEIDAIFRGIGHVYFFNVSGGEPFLREDLPQIIESACVHLKPGIIHIPTNALMPERIEKCTAEMLEIISSHDRNIQLTVKPSIDGVGSLHDEIRGVKGNFEKLIDTVRRLKKLESRSGNFHLELGTVVSVYNMDHLDEIEDFVHSLGVQSYRNEIAECREEFFNIGDDITPGWETYEKLMEPFSAKIVKSLKDKKQLARITESFRLAYYRLAVRIMKEKRQVIPCYGGISNVHLNYDGQLWPCCTIGYSHPLGNLRDNGLDFRRVWHSSRASDVRKHISSKKCWCPLANQSYSNMLIHIPSLANVMARILSA